MDYRVDVRFEPYHEFISSLHAYICRKSHKLLDLTPSWAQETRARLSPEFAAMLDQAEINGEWKTLNLLVQRYSGNGDAAGLLAWLESLTVDELYGLLSGSGCSFPTGMREFHERMLAMLARWEEQYFRHISPDILKALSLEAEGRLRKLPTMGAAEFVDEVTNGFIFTPVPGMEELILIPQYHFQPINIVYAFGKRMVCSYAARIDLDPDDFLSTHDYRLIRSLGEKSRLKILRFLHQGPRSFIEIVRHLRLSKGITHDHISNLRRAGLIYARFEGESLIEYSLRPRALQQIHNSLIAYIGKE